MCACLRPISTSQKLQAFISRISIVERRACTNDGASNKAGCFNFSKPSGVLENILGHDNKKGFTFDWPKNCSRYCLSSRGFDTGKLSSAHFAISSTCGAQE